MRKLILIVLGVILIMLAMPQLAVAKLDVKVGLVWNLAGESYVGFEVVQGNYALSADGKTLQNKVGPGVYYRLGSGPWGAVLFAEGNPLGVVKKVKLESVSGSLPVFRIYGSKATRTYRGSLELSVKDDGTLLAVNSLGEEEYLYGVVPIEMSNSWAVQGLEALKAQAVAARTYLHSHYDAKQAKGFNITDSPNIDQAYSGYSAEGAASRAVDASAGEILVDINSLQPINTSYHSHSGGVTEDSENVWGGVDPHLRSKPDPYTFGQGFLGDSWNFTASATALGRPMGLGPVVEIKLEKYPSGRVKNVKVKDVFGQTVSKTGRQFVGLYYPKDRGITNKDFLGNLFSFFVLEPGNSQAQQALPDDLELFLKGSIPDYGPRLDRLDTSSTPPRNFSQPYPVYVFKGSGWGHGVGMSQWGAYGMAKQGYTYRQILEYYYSDIKVIKAK
ncbi:MAG TPA: SpoIID/LytB domain-containing protein [Verrucomicrobiae bacterium]|nr:SpoIID/LytB domain-containing protein [Verrucomicrobiae bacterium]